MSKADVIEIEGTVVEKLPNAMFPGGGWRMAIRCWPISASKSAYELHQDIAGR